MRRAGTILAAVICVLALAGCGSDDPASQQTPTSGSRPTAPQGQPSAAQQAQIEEFQACLREQGAELPRRPPAGGGPPEMTEEMRKAFASCRDKLPAGGPGGGMPPGGASPGGTAPPASDSGDQS